MRSHAMIVNGIILIGMSFFTKNLNSFLEIDINQSDVIMKPMTDAMLDIFPLIGNLMVVIGISMFIFGLYNLFINNDYDYESSYVSNNYSKTNDTDNKISLIKNITETTIKDKSKKNNFFYDEEDNGFFQILHNLMTSNNTKSI